MVSSMNPSRESVHTMTEMKMALPEKCLVRDISSRCAEGVVEQAEEMHLVLEMEEEGFILPGVQMWRKELA